MKGAQQRKNTKRRYIGLEYIVEAFTRGVQREERKTKGRKAELDAARRNDLQEKAKERGL